MNSDNNSDMIDSNNLVGGLNPSEKYEFVSWDDDIPNMMGKIIHSCSKPPTSNDNKNDDITVMEMEFHGF